MPPVQSPHTDIQTSRNESTKYQELGLSNEINQNIRSYADALWGVNNIGDIRGCE